MSTPRTLRRARLLCLCLGLVLGLGTGWTLSGCGPATEGPAPLVVGSKSFTESVILGELVTLLARDAGHDVQHRRQLGGTEILWSALLSGEIDLYCDYTGTLLREVLASEALPGVAALPDALAARGLVLGPALGFENTYALGMLRPRAEDLGIATVSDLLGHPDLVLGLGHEFKNRPDGWPGLRQAYALPHEQVRGLDHDLAYRALAAGQIDVMDVYTTDAEIEALDLAVLTDDREVFPEYEAVVVLRAEAAERLAEVLPRLTGLLDARAMSALNARVRLDRETESVVAAEALASTLGVHAEVARTGRAERILLRTRQHLLLVTVSLLAAILVALPLGIVAARRPRLGQVLLAIVGGIQTIPSLALLVFMIPLLGIGGPPAIAALFLYSLLPIVRNTASGLKDIPSPLLESATALGLSTGARLRLVELPLASRSILAGIKTSAVINVGTATLGAFVGAGGFGQPILTGIRLDDMPLVFEGAIPAALLALAVQGLFDLSERWLVPAGLRLEPAS